MGLEGAALSTTSVVVSVIVINLIHKVWGEQAPTYLGVERPLEVARRTAPVLYWWNKVMYPVIIAGDGVAKWTLRLFGVRIERSWTGPGDDTKDAGEERIGRGDVRRAMGEVLARGRVSRDRRREVMKALEIEDIPVREIMLPVGRAGAGDGGGAWAHRGAGHHHRTPSRPPWVT